MGRELQKKKNKSSISKARRKPKSKKLLLQNSLIAANWDKDQTLAQNYRRLGLTARLNKNTGGVEKTAEDIEREREANDTGAGKKKDGLKIVGGSRRAAEGMEVREVGIERDPQTGKIVRVLDGRDRRPNPLGDPLNEFDSDRSDEEDDRYDQHGHTQTLAVDGDALRKTDVVRQLEEDASRPVTKHKRRQPEGERIFIETLVRKYGDDYGKMTRDMKINYMQRSEGDLKRRVKKWREGGGIID